MLNPFSRDIRSVRAQENIGVHLGPPCSWNIFPKKVMLTYRPIVAVCLRPNIEAYSWINKRPVGGMERTNGTGLTMSVFRGEAEVAGKAGFGRIDPTETRYQEFPRRVNSCSKNCRWFVIQRRCAAVHTLVTSTSLRALRSNPNHFPEFFAAASLVAFAFMMPVVNAADIVETAVSAGNFKTLVAAVTAAGLVDTLKGKGPFTVSPRPTKPSPSCRQAPSTVCSSQKTRPNSSQSTYHVVPGKVMSCQSAFKFDPGSASNFDPFERRVLAVALAPSELAGVAETGRARVA